jgi:murein L,D-transpeptidase YcbB/YkuD
MGYRSDRSVRIWIALVAIQFIWLALPVDGGIASAKSMTERVGDELRRTLSDSERQGPSFCRREALCGEVVLTRFYEQRDFVPAWVDGEGRFTQAEYLVGSIHEGVLEGLKPDVYHLTAIEALLTDIKEAGSAGRPLDPGVLSDLDLLLTDAFLIYGSHLLSGRVDPETIHSKWLVMSREEDLAGLLRTALEEKRVDQVLAGLLPRYPGYADLRQALLKYRGIEEEEGGWPPVPEGPTLHEDERDERVPALRARLIASGDLDGDEEGEAQRFDPRLVQGVRRFQGRHGLTVDGVVGPATLAALNVRVEERIRQIELNMERWRWLPDDLGRRYILVNSANFALEVIEDGERVQAMRVVAGRKARSTPVFTGKMTYMVLNPYWNIPHKLAVEDILPRIKEDPGYLTRRKIRVFESWENLAPEIQPETIDWSGITADNFSFKLRQDSGPSNALGRVKLMFPNKFAVYLHDTPARHMFARNQRDFSSGCIRIEKPIDLAAYVLQDDPEWTREKILHAIESGKNQIVWLPEPIPVHVLYWTAWVEGDGTTHFRNDVYDRDGPLDRALREGPPHS